MTCIEYDYPELCFSLEYSFKHRNNEIVEIQLANTFNHAALRRDNSQILQKIGNIKLPFQGNALQIQEQVLFLIRQVPYCPKLREN